MRKLNLIELYIYEVTRRLPEKTREDIALELQSTIEDMLPDHYSEEDIKHVLTNLGSPAKLASNYKGQHNYLIGPPIYDTYMSTIKLVIPWAIVITFLVHLIDSIFVFTSGGALLSALISFFTTTLVHVISVVLHVLFWVTLSFIIVERTGGLKINIIPEWTPEDLKQIRIIPKEKDIPLKDILISIIGTAFLSIVFFNADRLAGIYQSMENGQLTFIMPIFNQETLLAFWPIVILLVIMQVALLIYKWKLRKWTIPLAIVNLIIIVIATLVVIMIAKSPNLLNTEFLHYLANVLNMSSLKITVLCNNILMVTIFIIVITHIYEIYNSFRKAKL